MSQWKETEQSGTLALMNNAQMKAIYRAAIYEENDDGSLCIDEEKVAQLQTITNRAINRLKRFSRAKIVRHLNMQDFREPINDEIYALEIADEMSRIWNAFEYCVMEGCEAAKRSK